MGIFRTPKRMACGLLLAVAVGCASQAARVPAPWYEKDEITIVVTDSGLGGISVVAQLERRLRDARHFNRVHIVFFNALFSATGGYNALNSRKEKIHIFDRALWNMADRYEPDQILVACNTLSVLIDETDFVDNASIPVRSIVEPGVALIEEALAESPGAKVILFATRTTVEEDSHRQAIAEHGLNPDRVITQSCPELAATIELGFDSEEARLLIETFVFEAVEKLDQPSGPVYASLSCSHYPYAESLWRAALKEHGLGPIEILNPNLAMADDFLDVELKPRFAATQIVVTVVSMVEISEDRKQSIGRAVEPVSRSTAEALMNYRWQPDLF